MRQVTLGQLEAGMVLAQDVFLDGDTTHAFLREGFVLSWGAIDRLRSRKVASVMVADAPGESDESAADSAPPEPAAPAPKETLRSRVAAAPLLDEQLKQDAIRSLHGAFADIAISDSGIQGSPESVAAVTAVVDRLAGAITRSRGAAVCINDLKSYDDHTYHHSLAVAVLSMSIGQEMGLSGRDVGRLGLAAILHDVGKTAVPIEVIRKPARLSEQEYRLARAHSKAGSGYMVGADVRDEALWQAVLHHHERVDGAGYPAGLPGRHIPVWSRIISVADVYDALTSTRPHRNPVEAAAAQEYIMGGVGTAFDYDVVAALVNRVALYPVGGVLHLSNGEYGIVLDNENPMRPVVEILFSGKVVDLFRDRDYFSVVVKRTVPEPEASRLTAPGRVMVRTI